MKATASIGRSAPAARRSPSSARRGIAVLWLVLFLPLFLLLLCFVIEIGNLWMARAELETALESAALASVREWGEAGGGSTLTPREVGQTVALANRVRGTPLSIGLNRTPGGPNNENTNLTFPPTTANLVFGALTQKDPTVIFCPTATPACGFGTVMLDVTSNASLQADNAWGFNFLAPNPTPNLTLSRVVIDLRAGTDADAAFDFLTSPPVISDNSPNLVDGSVVFQNDVFGISNAALTLTGPVGTLYTWSNTQVAFVWDSSIPNIVTINFSAFGGDIGLEPGDRIRFGARVIDLSTGNGVNDGDGVGLEGVQATLTFAIAGVDQVPSVTATYVDSNFRGTNAPSTLDPDSAINSAPFILPNSPSNGNNNDGQSFVISAGGGGTNDFAVRAEAQVDVNPVCGNLFGGMFGPFRVHAHATAYYNCGDRIPAIIRVDSTCP